MEEKKGRQRSLLGGVADPESGKGERAAARQQGRSGRVQQQGREGGGAAAGGAGRRRRGRGAPAPAGRLRPRSVRQQGRAGRRTGAAALLRLGEKAGAPVLLGLGGWKCRRHKSSLRVGRVRIRPAAPSLLGSMHGRGHVSPRAAQKGGGGDEGPQRQEGGWQR